jgi:uncharacterized coiled-coil DUF342 family protein
MTKLTRKKVDKISDAASNIKNEMDDLRSALRGEYHNGMDAFNEADKLDGCPKKYSRKVQKLLSSIEDSSYQVESLCEEIECWADDWEPI